MKGRDRQEQNKGRGIIITGIIEFGHDINCFSTKEFLQIIVKRWCRKSHGKIIGGAITIHTNRNTIRKYNSNTK